jgi:hypothetical protein
MVNKEGFFAQVGSWLSSTQASGPFGIMHYSNLTRAGLFGERRGN